MHDPRFGSVILLCAVGVTVALGLFGAGHGGLAQTNLDMRFLYLAGLYWREGLNAYVPGSVHPADPWLAEAVARYDFAYPPQIAPLCMLLAAWSPVGARALMTGLNLAAALGLAALSLRCARDPGRRSRAGLGDAAWWAIPALVLGNPSTAFVIWAGQTTLIVILALMLGWRLARRDRWLIGGLLLAIATIKPQVSALPMLWLVLERRWRVLAAAALGVAALAAVPLLISGPVQLMSDWSAAAWRYSAGSYNTLGSRMVFGLRNLLFVAGVDAPVLLPLALLILGWFWWSRASVVDDDVLPILVGMSLLFGFAHGYDIAALIPLIPAFWRHVHERAAASVLALGLMLIVTLPNSLLEPYVSPLLLHLRVLALCVAVGWLMAMSLRRGTAGIGLGARRGLTPSRL